VEDINEFLKDVVDEKKIPHRGVKRPTVLLVAPPCQGLAPPMASAKRLGFSSGNSGGRNDLHNNGLAFLVPKAAQILQPSFLVFENVSALIRRSKRKYLAGILNGLLDLGYSIQMKILNASDYAVPQNRKRLFIVASAEDNLLPFWPSTSSNEKISVFDAIADLRYRTDRNDGMVSTYRSEPPSDDSYVGGMRANLSGRDINVVYNHRPDKNCVPNPDLRVLCWDGQAPTVMATKQSRYACLHPGIRT
jgi:site-specific DNA-cytosine methylase